MKYLGNLLKSGTYRRFQKTFSIAVEQAFTSFCYLQRVFLVQFWLQWFCYDLLHILHKCCSSISGELPGQFFILIFKMRQLRLGEVKYLSEVSELINAMPIICTKFYAFKNISDDIAYFRTISSPEFMLIFISDFTVKFLRAHYFFLFSFLNRYCISVFEIGK